MSAAVTYMIRATVTAGADAMPYVVCLPVRQAGMPSYRRAARLIRAQHPDARGISVRRSVKAHLAWVASGDARRMDAAGEKENSSPDALLL